MTTKRPRHGTAELRCAEFRAEGADSRRISGRAIVFNSPTVIGGCFREMILPEAISDELLANSDVVLTLEHNPAAGVLGRSCKGEGTLQLERRDDGVYVTCDLPESPLGDTVLEGVRRGDYRQMSFCFVVGDQRWEVCDDDIEQRTITSISRIYDVSIVAFPAYKDTSVAARSAEEPESTETDDDNDNEQKSDDNMAKDKDKDKDKDTVPAAEEQQQAQEQQEGRSANPAGAPAPNAFVPRPQRRHAEGGVSLMRIIRSQMRNGGGSMTEADQEYCRRGAEMMSRANLDFGGGIVLPVEGRAESGVTPEVPASTPPTAITAGAANYGAEAVATDSLNILGPLYNSLVLAQAGCTMMSGLVGNIKLPSYSGSSATWAAENDDATDGKGSFSEITFSPKRLTAYIDISNQFLIQDSVNAEALLRSDLAMALRQKLESTILGDAAGSATQPAGLFNGVTVQVTPTYREMIDLEREVEELNVTGELRYIMSPAIKAALRAASRDTGSGRFIMEGNDVNGIPALVTNNAKGIILGNFADFVICQWGGVELIVDTLTMATKAMTRIVINSYWDARPRRATFAKAKLKTT